MNQLNIRNQLESWILDFVNKPNPLLNNWAPCPYARQALLNDKTFIVFSDSHNLFDTVSDHLALLESKEVIIVCFDHTKIDAIDLEKSVATYNQTVLMPLDYVILEDHPASVEMLNGVSMNFGQCGLLLVSKLSMLNNASVHLKSKGYYDHWPIENLDAVVTWRFK